MSAKVCQRFLYSIYTLGQKYKNIFIGFLVQMKSLEFAFEINLPLVKQKFQTKSYVET